MQWPCTFHIYITLEQSADRWQGVFLATTLLIQRLMSTAILGHELEDCVMTVEDFAFWSRFGWDSHKPAITPSLLLATIEGKANLQEPF